MFVSVCGVTDAGAVRGNNEDAFAVVDLSTLEAVDLSEDRQLIDIGPRGLLAVVSDGMGGEKAGEVASALTIEAMRDSLSNAGADVDAETRLRDALVHANDRVRTAAKEAGRAGMGATAIGFLTDGKDLWTAEVGDSRAYLFRRGKLFQISKDQTYIQALIERGVTDPMVLNASRARNVILQAVGKAEQLSVAQTRVALRRGDVILLCSDGLHGLVPDDEIEAVLHSCLPDAPSLLVALANDSGGKDNITVLVAVMADESLPPATAAEDVNDTVAILHPYSLFVGAPPSSGSLPNASDDDDDDDRD